MGDKQKAQLHAVLAVAPGLKATASKLMKELGSTFKSKDERFRGRVRTYKADAADGEPLAPEDVPVATTVRGELDWLTKQIAPALDAMFQIDKSNLRAVATLSVVDEEGNMLFELSNVPATFLMQFDKFLSELRAVYSAIPTRDPKHVWADDEDTGKGHYATPEIKQYRAVKVAVPIELSPATERHPAQVQLVNKTEKVGEWTERFRSGALSPAKKSELLSRVDQFQRAVKRALSHANRVEHDTTKVGRDILRTINGDLV